MKKPKLILAGTAALAAMANPAPGALSLPVGGLTVDFSAVPAGADWASVPVAGGTGDLNALGTGANGMDNPTTGVSASLAWPAVETNWTAAANSIAAEPAASALNAQIRYVTGSQRMLTGPTGIRYQALIGRYTNSAGSAIESFDLAWTLGSPVDAGGTGAVGTDPIAGVHVYYSKTGTAGSWTLINGPHGADGVIGPVTVTPATRIAPGGSLYIAWIDDNGPGSGTAPNLEGHFTVDDVAISNLVLANASVTTAVSDVVRNDNATPTNPADDTVEFKLLVQGFGAVGAGWDIAAPSPFAGSGTYGVTKTYSGIPIAEFAAAPHAITATATDNGASGASGDFTVTAPWCALSASASNFVYNDPASPDDPNDDTVSYSVAATGTFTGPEFSVDTVPPQNVAYGNAAPITGVLPGSSATYNFVDSADASCTASLIVNAPAIIGSNTLSGTRANVLSRESFGANTWEYDTFARVLTMADGDRNGAGTAPKTLSSATVDLSAYSGAVKFSMDMTATDGSSGFEAADIFDADLILNDGTTDQTISLIAAYDTNNNGELAGAEIVAANTNRNFPMSYIIPDNIVSARVVIRGMADSGAASEKMTVQNILFEPAPPTLVATAGTATFDNKGTASAADDTYSTPVTIVPVNLGASTGWTSDLVAPDSPLNGLYAAPNPVPFVVSAATSPKTVLLVDGLDNLITATVTLTRPAPSLLASLVPGSVVRNVNGAGDGDDTITFDVNLTAANIGPAFTASTTLIPSTVTGSGNYPPGGVATLTLSNVPAITSTINVILQDVSYTNQATVAVPVPAAAVPEPAVMGQKNFGAGLTDVGAGVVDPRWINYPGGRQYVMTAGVAADSTAESELIDLSGVGAVNFTAKLRARDNSAGSNFEIGDRFKAELIIDGTQIVPLVTSAMDTGSGASAVVAPGNAGDPNGYINGYTAAAGTDVITAAVYATALENYNTNRTRDEFNTTGQPGEEALNAVTNFSYTIPESANSVQLKIYGAGVAGSEAMIVEDVLFTLAPVVADADSDGDGVKDADEAIMGTNPNDGADVLRLTQNPANPSQINFPTKAGRFYRVYVSDDANEVSHLQVWKDSGIASIVGDGNPAGFNVDVLPAEARRFYRLHVMQADGPWPASTP